MLKKILVTGGTVFVSRYTAEYFVKRGYDVYVLNRNSRPQVNGVTLIQCDRKALGNVLKKHRFDAVLDITAYNADDIRCLVDALGSFDNYIMISSSAVYPEYCQQPFNESALTSVNKYWGKYGTDKIAAETALQTAVPNAYILRPPYLYGQMNNVYREAFVFDCANADRSFYLPGDGGMKLQFFHVDDLCRFAELILETKPVNHIFNVGNPQTVTVKEWVTMCYSVAGKTPEFFNVSADTPQRNYFCFHNYEYRLDVTAQKELMPYTKPLAEGLKEAYAWYTANKDKVNAKPLIEYIDEHFQYNQY